MLLQTNSYIVPKEKRTEHARLLQRFRQLMVRIGCDHFEVFEQVGTNWAGSETGRFVQIMRFRDRQHWAAVQVAEKNDPQAKQLIQEFCDLINLPYQQQAGLFAAGYYNSVIAAQMPAGKPAPARRQAVPVSGMAAATAAAAVGAHEVEHAVEQLADAIEEPPASNEAPAANAEPIDITGDEPPTHAPAAGDAANGDIDILDYLEDVEPAPAGEEPRRERID